MSETAINIILIIVLVAAVFYNIYARFRRSMRSPMGRVISILGNLKKNAKLLDTPPSSRGMDRLKTDAWHRSKEHIGFLPDDIQHGLAKTFGICDEINDRIDSARKFKSSSYLAGIDLSHLAEPLSRSREQLQEWAKENIYNPEYSPPKRRRLFG